MDLGVDLDLDRRLDLDSEPVSEERGVARRATLLRRRGVEEETVDGPSECIPVCRGVCVCGPKIMVYCNVVPRPLTHMDLGDPNPTLQGGPNPTLQGDPNPTLQGGPRVTLQGGASSARPGERRWTTLAWCGVAFPAPYKAHGAPLLVAGSPVPLSPRAEEFATLFATKKVGVSAAFKAGFWADFAPLLPKGLLPRGPNGVERTLAECDFSLILAAKAEAKVKVKGKRKVSPSATAKVDGVPQPVAGFTVEGAGIFAGRGRGHPLAGRLKRRITPADVTLNVSRLLPQNGGTGPNPGWGAIVRDPFVDWVATWRDPLTGEPKYARLAPSGAVGQRVGRAKFERARVVASHMGRVKAALASAISSHAASGDGKSAKGGRQVSKGGEEGEATVQHAVCAWLLCLTALRPGTPRGENGAEGARGRFGVATLQVKHLVPVGREAVAFDFVGKDAVPFKRIVDVGPASAVLIKRFRGGKRPEDPLFDRVTPDSLNAYLGTLSIGLTAKEVRTAAACVAFSDALKRTELEPKAALLLAGARVAVLCNHRKGAPSSTSDPMGDLAELDAASDGAGVKAVIAKHGLALGTSRANYVDPRIPLTFAKAHGLPATAALPGKALGQRFAWAVEEVYGSF